MAKYQYQQVTGPLVQYEPAELAWQQPQCRPQNRVIPARLAYSLAGVVLLISAPDPAAALDWLPKAEQPQRTLQARSGTRTVAPVFPEFFTDWLPSCMQPARGLPQIARVTSSVSEIFPEVLRDWYPLTVQPQRFLQSRNSDTVAPIFQTSPLDWIPTGIRPTVPVRVSQDVTVIPAPQEAAPTAFLDWLPTGTRPTVPVRTSQGVRTVAPVILPTAPIVFLDWQPLARQPQPKLRPRAGSYVISPIIHPISDEQAVDPGPAVAGQERGYQYQQIAAPLPFDAPQPGQAADPPAVAGYSVKGYQYQSLAAPFFIAPTGFNPADLTWLPQTNRHPYRRTSSKLGEFIEPPPGGVYDPRGLQWQQPQYGHRARGLLLRPFTSSVSDPVNPDQPTFNAESLTWLPSVPAYPRALTAGRLGEYLDPLIQVRTPDLEWLPAGEYPSRRLVTLLVGDISAPVFIPPDPALLDWSPESRGDIQRQLPLARGTRAVQPSLTALPFEPQLLQWLPEAEYYWSFSVYQYQAYVGPVLVPPFVVFNPSSLEWLPSGQQPPRSKPYARIIPAQLDPKPIFFDPSLSLSFLPSFEYPGRKLRQARVTYSILDLIDRPAAIPTPEPEPDDDVTPGCIEPKCPGPKKKPPKKREPKKLRALKAENKVLREQSEALKIIVNAITNAVGEIETKEDYDRIMKIVEIARNQIADFVHKREMLNVIIMTLLMLEDD